MNNLNKENNYLLSTLEKIKENLEWNGFFTLTDLKKWNINQDEINQLIKNNLIKQHTNDWYYIIDYLFDEFFYFALKLPESVYSGNCSAFFHNMSANHCDFYFFVIPDDIEIGDWKQIFNDCKRKGLNIIIHKQHRSIYELGVIETKTSFGSIVKITNREKTLCDILKYKEDIDLEDFLYFFEYYFCYEKEKINNEQLNEYAKLMGLENEINFVSKNWNDRHKMAKFYYEKQ